MDRLQAHEVGDGMDLPRFRYHQSEHNLTDLTIAGIEALTEHMREYVAAFRDRLDRKVGIDFGMPDKSFSIDVTDNYAPEYGLLVRSIECVFSAMIADVPDFRPVYKRHGLAIQYNFNVGV